MSQYYSDLLVEIICRSLGDDYYHETFINDITIQPPTDNGQTIEIKNTNGEKFRIEVTKL